MSAMMEKRLVIVGLGKVGLRYIEMLSRFPEVQLEAVVTPETGRARRRLEGRTQVFSSVDEMLKRGCVPHIAIVTSPPSTHLDVVQPLLLANVDVMIEPPIATTPHDADKIATLAERLGRVVCTAARFRVHNSLVEIRRRLEAGRIGRLCQIEVNLSGKRDPRGSWHGDPELSGGGVWMEHGADALDAAEELAGPVYRIRMLASQAEQGGEVEDRVRVETEHDGGISAKIHVSWNEELDAPFVRCIGDRGEIVLGSAQSVLTTIDGHEECFAPGYDSTEAAENAFAFFLRARMAPEGIIDHGAQTFCWLHAAYRSLSSRRWELA